MATPRRPRTEDDDTVALLDIVSCYRMAMADHGAGLSATPPTASTARLVGILRRLTSVELDWLHHMDDVLLPRPSEAHEQPSHEAADDMDVFLGWQAACEQSLHATAHLRTLCTQGRLTVGQLRVALIPLLAEYARCDGQLNLPGSGGV